MLNVNHNIHTQPLIKDWEIHQYQALQGISVRSLETSLDMTDNTDITKLVEKKITKQSSNNDNKKQCQQTLKRGKKLISRVATLF